MTAKATANTTNGLLNRLRASINVRPRSCSAVNVHRIGRMTAKDSQVSTCASPNADPRSGPHWPLTSPRPRFSEEALVSIEMLSRWIPRQALHEASDEAPNILEDQRQNILCSKKDHHLVWMRGHHSRWALERVVRKVTVNA
jgi:hypothetical protein